MSIKHLATTLFHPLAVRRPDIERQLDDELDRHERVMRDLLSYARSLDLETGPNVGETGTAQGS